MYKTILKLNIITPLFMSGAAQNAAEFRTASIKGALRYWWRAAMAEDDIKKLENKEASIFGGTTATAGKSKIMLNIKGMQLGYPEEFKGVNGKYGLKYLLYSVIIGAHRKAFVKGNVTISIRSRDIEPLKQAVSAFWLAVNLGGFGTRSRRGAGSLQVQEVNGESFGLDFRTDSIQNIQGLERWLKGNIAIAKENIGNSNKGTKKYRNLNGAIIKIVENNNWENLLDAIGNSYKQYRSKNNMGDIMDKGNFGMPVIFRKKPYKLYPVVNNEKKEHQRLGSPLYIKVIKSHNTCYGLLIVLGGDVIYNGKIGKFPKLKSEKIQITTKSENKEIIIGFLDSLHGTYIRI